MWLLVTIAVIIVYLFFGIINAIAVAMCIIDQDIKANKPYEYWLAVVVSIIIWPVFTIRMIFDSLRRKNERK